jgi:hypothetical protein
MSQGVDRRSESDHTGSTHTPWQTSPILSLMPRVLRYKFDLVLLLLTSGALFLPRPFLGNQNTYLLHAVAGRDTRLQSDWLASTPDTNQFFTRVASTLMSVWGVHAIHFITYVFFAICLLSIYFLVLEYFKSVLLARIAVIVIAIAQSPGQLIPALRRPFNGLGGQYVLGQEGYFQPAVAGAFLLLSLALLSRRLWIPAGIAGSIACATHPSLLFSSLAITGLLLIATSIDRKTVNLRYASIFIGYCCVLVGVTVLLNSNYLKLLSGSPEQRDALRRFAFERIPHHTLMSNWDWYSIDLWIVLVWACAIALSFSVMRVNWLGYFLTGALAFSMVSAMIVQQTENTTLALLFPWRLSVVCFPISFAIVVAALAKLLRERGGKILIALGVALLLPISVRSVNLSVINEPPLEGTKLAAAMNSELIQGTGFIPTEMKDVRLNLRRPIYVDWKSAPYLGPDLAEWWRRIDQASRIEQNPEMFCELDSQQHFGWVISKNSSQVPGCLTRDFVKTAAGKYQLYVRARP